MIILLISTVAVHRRRLSSARRIGPSSASNKPNWKMPSAINVTLGGRVLLSPSSGDPTIASGYGPWLIRRYSVTKPAAE